MSTSCGWKMMGACHKGLLNAVVVYGSLRAAVLKIQQKQQMSRFPESNTSFQPDTVFFSAPNKYLHKYIAVALHIIVNAWMKDNFWLNHSKA